MQQHSLFLLGRLPGIGRAELESLFGAEHLTPVGEHAMACDLPAEALAFGRLGGSLRLASILDELETTQWAALARSLAERLPRYLEGLPAEGKLKLGLSCFDLTVQPQQVLRAGLELKKVCKQRGRSVRLVPNTTAELSTAQVLHNQLTSQLGLELVLVRSGSRTLVARTVAVQDITAYARRDQNRPKRDARVGMLPPKLAQTIVNLAVGSARDGLVLDPFCGTGVVLQETLLMGYPVYGTDLEPRMIDFTRHNMEWLAQSHPDLPTWQLETGDATEHRWQPVPHCVASETYLGRPLAVWPPAETLHDIIGTCNAILEKFLANLRDQLPVGTRLCLAVPAWLAPQGPIRHLPLLDHLSDLGYNRVSFEHARTTELIYSRPGQLVARELLVITRK